MGYSYVFNPLAGAFDTVQNLQTVRAPDNAYIPPTGPTVFSDAFTEASTTLLDLHTPNVGSNWSLALSTGGATYSVFNNGTVRPTTTLANVGCLYLANNVAPAAAVEVSITASAVVTGPNVVGLVFRYVNSNNFYLLTLSNTQANCILYKKVAGTWTNLGPTSIGMAVGAVWRVRAVGQNIVVYANDVIVKITPDTGISAAGLCGLSAGTIGQNATDDIANTWQLDNFSVINYASSGGLITNGINVTGDIRASGQIVGHGNNSAIYPAITFANDTNTGLYVSAADNLSIATGGSTRATFNSGGLAISGACYVAAGSAAGPSISFGADGNTGFYNSGADSISVSTAGTQKWRLTSTGQLLTPTAGLPSGSYDIATAYQISSSAGDLGGFLVFNGDEDIYTRFQARNYSGGGGIYGDGKLYLISGFSYGTSYNPGIDIFIEATGYGSQTGDFNLGIAPVSGSNGGNVSIGAGGSDYLGSGGGVTILAGNSTDGVGGSTYISAGVGSAGGATTIEAGYSQNTTGGTLSLLGGGSALSSTGSGGSVFIQGGSDGIGGYGTLLLQPYGNSSIAIFTSAGSTQVTTAITPATVSFGTGTTVTDDTTYDGYTIGQVVAALRAYGWLA